MSKSHTVGSLILRRIVPISVAALVVTLFVSRFYATRILKHQAETRVQIASVLTAGQLARELDDLTDYVRALADNHVIVQALISEEQRRTQLPPFFRTLRLPNTAFRSIAMFDYAGRPLVANASSVDIDVSPLMESLAAGKDILQIDGQNILVACPIRFRSIRNASTEGVLAAEYDTRAFLQRFQNSDESRRLRVFLNGEELYSDQNDISHPDDWLTAKAHAKGSVPLVVEQAELRETAFASLRGTDIFLLAIFLCSIAALGGTILYSSRIITNPLASMIAQISRIEDQRGLAQRLTTDGPREFQMLAVSFNRMMQDLSETTVSRDELQTTKDRLQLALEGGNIGLWSWDVGNNTVFVSRELSAQVGEKQAFKSYETFLDRLHPEDRDATQKAVEDCFQGLTTDYEKTFRLRHRNGSYRWILSRGRVSQWASETPTHMIGVHVDISKRIEAEHQLRSINSELERSNEELAQFAYIASHDLQEPLRKIISFSTLLQDEVKASVSEDGDMFMEHIIDAAQRMRTLIQDLLTFSRVESEGAAAEIVDPKVALRNAQRDLQLTIQSSQAKIECEPLPQVMADLSQLTQLFHNLLSNGIKYCEKQPEIQITSEIQDGKATIRFIDNGIGIAPTYRQRVFGIFKRLHGRGTYSGNGIGLAVCKRIVERFNGRIWIDEAPGGQGACFAIELPTAPVPEPAEQPPANRPPAPLDLSTNTSANLPDGNVLSQG